MYSKTDKRTTPLHEACLNGEYNVVKELLANDKIQFQQMLNTIDYNNNLPLDRVAARGHKRIAELLIQAHKESNDCDYIIYNKQEYTPLLSAVRWYCKVLDGTYAKGNCLLGKFNTASNFKRDYMNLIKLLMDSYPEHKNTTDNKGCNSLYYVILHLAEAIKSKAGDNKNVVALSRLSDLLIKEGVSLDITNKQGWSPRSRAEQGNILTLVTNMEQSDSESLKIEKPHKKNKSKKLSNQSVNNFQSWTSVVQGQTSSMINKDEHNFKTVAFFDSKTNKNHLLVKNAEQIKVNDSQSMAYISSLANSILQICSNSLSKEINKSLDATNKKNVLAIIKNLLLIAKPEEGYQNLDRKGLTENLATSLHVERNNNINNVSTGTLFSNEIISTITLDENEFCNILQNMISKELNKENNGLISSSF